MNTPHQHSSPALVAHMCTFLFKNRAILLITAGKGTRVVQSLGIAIIMMMMMKSAHADHFLCAEGHKVEAFTGIIPCLPLRQCFYHILEKLKPRKSTAHPQGCRAAGRGNPDSDTGFGFMAHPGGRRQDKGLAVAGMEERCWGPLGFCFTSGTAN